MSSISVVLLCWGRGRASFCVDGGSPEAEGKEGAAEPALREDELWTKARNLRVVGYARYC